CCEVDHTKHDLFEKQTGRWDRFGIFLSSVCAVHCLLTPLLVLSLPFLGEIFEHQGVHVGLAFFVIPVASYAFVSGYKHHRHKLVLLMGLFAAFLVGAASLMPHSWVEYHDLDVVTILGSVLLLVSHILNRRACLCHIHP